MPTEPALLPLLGSLVAGGAERLLPWMPTHMSRTLRRWLRVAGDPLRIMQRAGHENFETTQGYLRLANALRVGFGDVFPALRSYPR